MSINRFMSKFRYLFISILSVLLIFSSCSTKKNTIASRSYHNLTAHYNVYFNGKESYKKGLKRLEQNYKEDYTVLLPVFQFPNAEAATNAVADMDRTIKKASKTIVLHSITAKPDIKKGIKTQKQKEFYNKREYNKWIDDAYLLMGKAYFMKLDLYNSNASFRQIIKEYPKENTGIEAQIMLTRKLLFENEFSESADIINNLKTRKKFPKKYNSDLRAIQADYAIRKKQYPEAAKMLEEALEFRNKKNQKLRYHFILGQLYQLNGQYDKSLEHFKKVIKLDPPYEMAFNARINMANSFEAGSDASEIRRNLYKLMKDEKNKEFLDQIYYALGQIDLKEGKKKEALDNYSKSCQYSTTNTKQKARSFLAMAKIYYADKEYLQSQKYYDSVLLNIDEFFPEYPEINSRARNLQRLAKNLNTVSFEDSVQFVARMSENERNIFIDRIIATVKEKEAEEARKQQEEMMAEQTSMYEYSDMQARNQSSSINKDQSGKWYFYPSSKSYGENEFLVKWGKRKLEDNWRRSNKKQMSFDESAQENTLQEVESEGKETDKKKVKDNKSREYYMQDLPLTDSAMAASHDKIKKSLYNAAQIYKDDLSEYLLAAELYQDQAKRYPKDEATAQSLYQLFILYKQIGENEKANMVKARLINDFPGNIYTQIVNNPEFVKQLQDKENQINEEYNKAYLAYQGGDYQQALDISANMLANNPKHKIAIKFIFVKYLAEGKIYGLDSLRRGLNYIVSNYGKTEEAVFAKSIIAQLDQTKPEIKKKEEIAQARAVYAKPEKDEKHLVIYIANDKKTNVNQLVFNTINYNLDNFVRANLSVKAEQTSQNKQMVVIREFANMQEAINYYSAITRDKVILMKDVTKEVDPVVISEKNYNIFKQDGNDSAYREFFNENYNK